MMPVRLTGRRVRREGRRVQREGQQSQNRKVRMTRRFVSGSTGTCVSGASRDDLTHCEATRDPHNWQTSAPVPPVMDQWGTKSTEAGLHRPQQLSSLLPRAMLVVCLQFASWLLLTPRSGIVNGCRMG